MSVTRRGSAGAILAVAAFTWMVAQGQARHGSGGDGAVEFSTDPHAKVTADQAASGKAAVTSDCLRCHESIQQQVELEVPHEPAADGDCGMCHNPHAARFPGLLNSRQRALCFVCHQDQRVQFSSGVIHQPIREERCTDCHDPHGSENGMLLTEEGNDLCFGCHEDKQFATGYPTTHEPFAEGDCSDCHDPHQSQFQGLTLAPANSMCTLCHDLDDDALLGAHKNIPILGTDCSQCHDSHGSPYGMLVREHAHEPFVRGQCQECHVLEGPALGSMTAIGARLCERCHEGIRGVPGHTQHAPVAEGACDDCHVPHAGRFDMLLAAPAANLCKTCHVDVVKTFEESRSKHPLSEDDGACMMCHLPHSSAQPHLTKGGPIRTCLECHESQRHGHPLGSSIIDPRTGEPVTCMSCHEPHGSSFGMTLRGNQDSGLCLECHTLDDGGHGDR